jgi:ABC-type branched-subunit amino acid transport system ATPase component
MRIQLSEVTKKYGSMRALDRVSLDIEPGQVVALPSFGGDWQGINAAFCSGGFIPVFAFFPIGYWEIQ